MNGNAISKSYQTTTTKSFTMSGAFLTEKGFFFFFFYLKDPLTGEMSTFTKCLRECVQIKPSGRQSGNAHKEMGRLFDP